jgi:hypothetical protein
VNEAFERIAKRFRAHKAWNASPGRSSKVFSVKQAPGYTERGYDEADIQVFRIRFHDFERDLVVRMQFVIELVVDKVIARYAIMVLRHRLRAGAERKKFALRRGFEFKDTWRIEFWIDLTLAQLHIEPALPERMVHNVRELVGFAASARNRQRLRLTEVRALGEALEKMELP